MSVLVNKAREQIEKILLDAANKAIKNGELPECELAPFKVEVPADRKNGDYAVNAAMVWARGFKAAPRAIAEKLMANADIDGSFIEKYEIDINEAQNMVIKNEIEDAKTSIGILLAKELI